MILYSTSDIIGLIQLRRTFVHSRECNSLSGSFPSSINFRTFIIMVVVWSLVTAICSTDIGWVCVTFIAFDVFRTFFVAQCSVFHIQRIISLNSVSARSTSYAS